MTSFVDAIAPLTLDDIQTLRRSRSLKFVPRTNGAPVLLDWRTFWQLVEDDLLPVERFLVTYKTKPVAHELYRDDGKMNRERLARLFEQGISVVARGIGLHVPAIAELCRDGVAHGLAVDAAGAIVTTGTGGALRRHYDRNDIVILQQEGMKRWRIYGPPEPDPAAEKTGKSPPDTAPIFDEVLRPGDMLFLPAGYWHHCDNSSERSLHLGLAMSVPSGPESDASDFKHGASDMRRKEFDGGRPARLGEPARHS